MTHTGEQKIQWAQQYMPVLNAIRERLNRLQDTASVWLSM